MKQKIISIGIAILITASCLLSGCASSPETVPDENLTLVTPEVTAQPEPEATVEPTAEPTAEPTPEPTQVPEDAVLNPLNGSVLEDPSSFAPMAVIVENSAASRPQSGIGLADIIYEVYMEGGGITRLVALFSDQLPEMVGPVRSLRIHHVHVISQMPGIALVHYGAATSGEYDAYEQLKKTTVGWRADGVMGPNSQMFWRDSKREAPHNAYADLTKDAEAAGDFFTGDLPKLLNFDPSLAQNKGTDGSYLLAYTNAYKVTYEYLPEEGGYHRYYINDLVVDAGKDVTGKQDDVPLLLSNVIVMHTHYTYGGSANYADYENVGSGDAEFLIQGRYIKGHWARDSYNEPFRYTDEAGEEISFCPGQTWVDIVYDKESCNLTPTDQIPGK